MNKFFGKIAVFSVNDNEWELWHFIREFPTAAMLKSIA